MSHQLEFSIRKSFLANHSGITIPFTMMRNDLVVEGYAKIDTGSEYCLFQYDLAEAMGINVESGTRIDLSTLGGRIYAYAHAVTLDTFGITFESTVLFSPSTINRNILGRIGWLNNLQLALSMNDETISLNSADGE